MLFQGKAKYPITEIVLHCAAVSGDWHNGKTVTQMRDEIDGWHRKKGWRMIGYHRVFAPNGDMAEGRAFSEIGAHVIDHNRGTLGFLMIESVTITKMGRWEDYFLKGQRERVRSMIRAVRSMTDIKKVSGHNDYANKLCPGFKVISGDWM